MITSLRLDIISSELFYLRHSVFFWLYSIICCYNLLMPSFSIILSIRSSSLSSHLVSIKIYRSSSRIWLNIFFTTVVVKSQKTWLSPRLSAPDLDGRFLTASFLFLYLRSFYSSLSIILGFFILPRLFDGGT